MSTNICADMVRANDPDRYLATMAAPVIARVGLFALYAFNLEIARAPWASGEAIIAEMRLQWWHDAIDDLYAGTIRAHQILAPLAEVIARHDLPQNLFLSMINARRFDIYRDPHADSTAFDIFINATSGNLMQLAAMALGASPAALPVISDFAYGAGVANLLRAVPELQARGRKPLVLTPDAHARSAVQSLQTARRKRAEVDTTALGAMLVGWRADATLKTALKYPAKVGAGLLQESPAQRHASLIWRRLSGLW
ncbi:MAG: squalene/phytoene synthase family protein [Paracoccaceae bacterium]